MGSSSAVGGPVNGTDTRGRACAGATPTIVDVSILPRLWQGTRQPGNGASPGPPFAWVPGEHRGEPFAVGRRECQQRGGQLVEPAPFVGPFAFAVPGDGSGDGRFARKCAGFRAALRVNPRVSRGIRGLFESFRGGLELQGLSQRC